MNIAVDRLICTRAVLDVARQNGIDVDEYIGALIAGAIPHFWYPDGSLEVVGQDACGEYERTIVNPCRGAFLQGGSEGDTLYWGVSRFFGLSHQELVNYRIWFYGKWASKMYDDTNFSIDTKRGTRTRSKDDVQAFEADPEKSLITIVFNNRLSERRIQSLVKVLECFFATAKDEKYFETQPISLESNLMVASRTVQFVCDTSRCGVRPIAWLILTLLDFYQTASIEMLSFLSAAYYWKDITTLQAGVQPWEVEYGPFDRSIPIVVEDKSSS